ncbi:hypothetical protein WEI85_03235 [Actinomycetes bacterium KLBMP 9797]
MTADEPVQPPQDTPPPHEAPHETRHEAPPPQPAGAVPSEAVPPAAAAPKRRMSGVGIALLASAAVVGLVGVATVGIAIYSAVTPDSGIVACEAIRDEDQASADDDTPTLDDDELTEEEYRELREQFEDSTHADIREHGTKLVDVVWQVEQLPEGQEVAALGFLGPLTEHARGLQAACGRQGIHFSID